MSLPPGGGDVVLSWDAENTAGLILNPGSISVPQHGTRTVSITRSTDFTLSASGSTRGADRTALTQVVHVEVEKLAVSGIVLTPDSSAPAIGLQVRINGGDPVTTGTDGRFTVPDVSPPYSVLVHDPAGVKGQRYDEVWLDLTDAHPTVLAGDTWSSGPQNLFFDVNVTWTGGDLTNVPPNADPLTEFLVFSDTGSEHDIDPARRAAGSYSVEIASPTQPQGPVEVFVLRGYSEDVLEGDSVRTLITYQSIGHATLQPPFNWPVSTSTIAMEPTDTLLVPVEVNAGAWLGDTLGHFNVHLPGMAPVGIFGDGSYSRSYSIRAPKIPNASLFFTGWAESPPLPGKPTPEVRIGETPLDSGGTLVLDVATPPMATASPTNGGKFAFTRESPGPCRVLISQALSAQLPEARIHSDRREFTPEFLRSIGLQIEPSGYWDAECPAGFSSYAAALADLVAYHQAFEKDRPGTQVGYFGPLDY